MYSSCREKIVEVFDALEADATELGGTLVAALADRLRITRADASRRIGEAAERRVQAEAQLARLGGQHRPDELSRLADKLTDCLNPDGNFTDDDRARRRGVTIGNQGIDGMSPITGHLTPEARATLDAVFAKLAPPGMCNPFDQEPVVDGTPSQDAIDGDTRSCAQRNHDALNAECHI
jgi:hypothetical protein